MSLGLKVTICFLNLASDKVTQLLRAQMSASKSPINPTWHRMCPQRGKHHPPQFSQGGRYHLVNGLYLKGNDGKPCSEKSFCSWKVFLKVPFGHEE